MSEQDFITDVTTENLPEVVLDQSSQRPVLVDFWAPWCGPCQSLMPVLTALAQEYAGQFVLAKVNIDEQQDLAMQFGVRSVPTVKLFRHGAEMEQFLGVQPESEIRALLDRYIEKESDRIRAAAGELAAEGRSAEAITLLEEGLAAEPHSADLKVALAEMKMQQHEYAEAAGLLESLRPEQRQAPEPAAMLGRLEFVKAVEGAPSTDALEQRLAAAPDDSEARYQLSARKVLAGDYEGAMEELLELVRRDRSFGDDAGRKGLLRIFDILGGEGDLVARYRSRMFNMLY
jgi:putative thioredoxin